MKTKRETQPPKTPTIKHHKASGQGYIRIDGRAIYFGKYDLPETQQKYHQFIAEWLASGRQLPSEPDCITINEMVARFWEHAQKYYVHYNNRPTSEINNFKSALRLLKQLYGHMKVYKFGPLALRAVRQRMIDQKWCRTNVNRMVGRIKMVFRWATENELVPGSVYHALQAVAGLKQGRSEAKESEPVKPVKREYIDAVKPYVSRQVWAIVQLQLLTAARSGEIVILRPCDIDRSGKIWVYCPSAHKTAHYGHQRTIYIGPQAQKILRPFLLRPSDAFCFSPAEADAERHAQLHAARKTPLNYGNCPGSNRSAAPVRTPGNRYTVAAYRRAITRATKRAYRPADMNGGEFRKWKAPQHWHPHQLRHNAATELRKEFGLEAARIILGHRSAAITEVYAELDQQKAIDAMMKIG